MPRRNRSRPDHRRTAIAQEAARLMQEHGLRDFRSAKEKAGLRLQLGDKGALPSNQEVELAMAERNRIFRGDEHEAFLDVMRQQALQVMAELAAFDPRLVGGVLAGTATETSAIELHAFSDTSEALGAALEALGLAARPFEQRLRVRRDRTESFPGYRFQRNDFDFRLTVFPERGRGNAPLSAIDSRPTRRATARDVAALLAQRLPTST
ncbi:hypothetical protein GPROT2_02498 [Gammaproteobacteria bacterium]|nr:hypothetical protein [Gammaproteobacteria bacterium]QOJ32773.1 MAG: hypothetical protein HRU81_11995 [Gammaproteobacteria bacterium]CAG0944236.1 hypothetical protein GPROT2_02498 [Gammaproteobacteria bacterium]